MEKFEYGDLYKFLVSAGIVLIGLSILAPWFYLKESFDLLVEKQKFELLTDVAQSVIYKRHSLLNKAYRLIPWISGSLFFLGLASTIWGLKQWFRKQLDIDKREVLTTQKLEFEVKSMTPEEVEEKQTIEYMEAVGTVSASSSATGFLTSKEEYVSKYKSIEDSIVEKLRVYWRLFETKRQVRIDGHEYDLILISKILRYSDTIIEFKYYVESLDEKPILDALFKLSLNRSAYMEKLQKAAKATLIVIVPKEYYNESQIDQIKIAAFKRGLLNDGQKIAFLVEEEIDCITHEFLNTIIG